MSKEANEGNEGKVHTCKYIHVYIILCDSTQLFTTFLAIEEPTDPVEHPNKVIDEGLKPEHKVEEEDELTKGSEFTFVIFFDQ